MATDVQTADSRSIFKLGVLRLIILELILVALFIFLVVAAPGFASVNNLLNVLRAVSMLGIIAFGMTAVIIAGEIDLSVGAGAAMAGCLLGWVCGALTNTTGPLFAATVGCVTAISVGALCGLFTGKMREWFKVPSFITTLALLTALRGFANLISGGFQSRHFRAASTFSEPAA